MPKDVKDDISDLIVTTDVMAGILGFTRQRVNQLAKEGVLEKKAPGRFYLMHNIKKYIEFIRLGSTEDEDDAATYYWEEKGIHERAKREISELKLAVLKNRLHDAADIEMVITGMLVTFRSRMLGMPAKLAPLLIGQTNQAEVQTILDKEVREALTELSEYDPAMFAGGGELVDEEEDEEFISENP